MLENPRILLLVAVSCALCVASCVQAAPRVLAKDAVARCGIVLAEEAGPVERHAADELARYLGQVSGARVTIQTTPQSDAFPIYLGTLDSRIPLSAAITARAALVAPQGFLLAVGDDGARILGRQPIGVLYGVYHLLKTTAGLRWFAPGAEFEYCPQTTTLTIADQLTVSNPSFRYRTTGFVCCNWNSKTLDTWDWLVRNGMTITVGSKVYQLYREELEKRGAVIQDGGHVFAELLSDELFDVHPEYFPLIDGKRRRQHEAGVPGWPQPCTSNPDVARIMTENLLRKLTPGGGVPHRQQR